MLIEFREYICHPGQRDRWLKIMAEQIVPFQTSKGVVVLGMWVSETDPNLFYWMRRFDDEAARERIYKAVYESDTWKNELSPLVQSCIDRTRIKNTRMIPAPTSVMQ
jgi:quinol monooxygenase YgiN